MKNETESQLEIRALIDAMTYVRTWLMLYHQNAMQIAQEKGIWKYYLQPNDNAPEDTKVIACSVISAEALHFYEITMESYLKNAQNFLKVLESHLCILDDDDYYKEAIETAGLRCDCFAPTPQARSMTAAIEMYLEEHNK